MGTLNPGGSILSQNVKGVDVITVGQGGDYPATEVGLQAAINAVVAKTHFTETLLTGTVSINNKTKTVTGGGTTLFRTEIIDGLNRPYLSLTGDTTRKWYPYETVTSNTSLYLDVNFQEANASGRAVYKGVPIIHTIEIHEPVTLTNVYVNATGAVGGGSINANIQFIWPNGGAQSGIINYNLNSGQIFFRGMRGTKDTEIRGETNATLVIPDVILTDLEVDTYDIDFFNANNTTV